MDTRLNDDILGLSVPERTQLMEDIWDSIDNTSADLPVTELQKAELARRLASYDRNPEAGAPWPEVRKRIQEGP